MPNYNPEQYLVSIRVRVIEVMKKKIAEGIVKNRTEFAKRIDETPQAVSKWERGTAFPTINHIIDIRKQFGVSLEYLLLGAEESGLEQRVSRIEKYLKINGKENGKSNPENKRNLKVKAVKT